MMPVVSAALLGLTLTVSPDLLSPQEALAKIRDARKAGETGTVHVAVRGINCLSDTLRFSDLDHDIVFEGCGGAAFSGGVVLRDWSVGADGVWTADAPKDADGRTRYFDQLWANGRRAPCARIPDEGWLRISATTQTVLTAENGVTNYLEIVSFDDARADLLAKVPEEDFPYLEVGVISKWAYALRTLSGFDGEAKVARMETRFRHQEWNDWRTTDTLVSFMNVRTAFDAPGEWFLDMAAGKVRYRPLPGESPATTEIVVPRAGMVRIVEFAGDFAQGRKVRNVTFRNIRFEHSAAVVQDNRPVQIKQFQAAMSMPGAITAEGADGLTFESCSVRHTAGYGMLFGSGCLSNAVIGCRLEDLGAGGIRMGAGKGIVAKLPVARRIMRPVWSGATAYNLVSNCSITCGGRYNPEGVGVLLTHCSDTRVIHNDIRDFYYTGVSVGLVWGFQGSVAQRNEIAWNRISDLGKHVLSDMGGVYTLGTSFGTTVHDNVIHDVWSFAYGGWGLYCDEGSEGIVLERNLCWNTTDGGFHQHYGSGCIVRNNIFAYNRELGAVRMRRDVVQGVPCTLHFLNNIVYGDHGPLVGEGVRKVGGVWSGNLWYDARGLGEARFDGLTWSDWKACGKEVGSVFADPHFVDPAGFDFALDAESPAFQLGFRPFDVTAAGSTLEKKGSDRGAK